MNLKTLSWFLWPLVLILGVGFWWWISADQPTNQAGRRVYVQHCANCHMESGQGLRKLMPRLNGSDYLMQMSPEALACMIRYGAKDSMLVNGTWFDRPMPGNQLLTEVEITSLINYLHEAFVVEPKEKVTFQGVSQWLNECAESE